MNTINAAGRVPRLLTRGALTFTFSGVPLVAERLSLRKRMNLLKSGLTQMLRPDRVFGLPPSVQMEPTNRCNLKCPLCPTGTDSSVRPKGTMSMETFERALDELGDTLVLVLLYGWGEPFLNANLPAMIEACTARDILTVTSTNGHFLQTLDDALRVVDAGLSGLIIAMDGSSQEIYEAYRRSGSLEKVKRCASLTEEAKARRGVSSPCTNLQVVATKDNQADLGNIESLARAMGVNVLSCKTVACLTHGAPFEAYEPTKESLRRYDYQGSRRQRRPPIHCMFPFRQPTIFWDGTVVGCEFDYDLEAPWGKIGEESFAQIWNNRRAAALRRIIRTGSGRPSFCARCTYQDAVTESRVLSWPQGPSEGSPSVST
jgi:radical SAM protein with 4Fe4S-binding SPASM domain